MIDLILIGGGGHCTSCIDVIEEEGKYRIAGILDTTENLGQKLLSYEIMGTDEDASKYIDTHQFLITVGQITTSTIRRRIDEKLCAAGAIMATVTSPKAQVSKHATIGAGTIIMHHACVNAGVTIGENCIINTGANIEHDCQLGNHIHVSTHAVVNGNCSIGDGSFIGSNSTLIQGIVLQQHAFVGAGAVVVDSFPNPGVYIGNPAKERKA